MEKRLEALFLQPLTKNTTVHGFSDKLGVPLCGRRWALQFFFLKLTCCCLGNRGALPLPTMKSDVTFPLTFVD